jgi:hypothetical protein
VAAVVVPEDDPSVEPVALGVEPEDDGEIDDDEPLFATTPPLPATLPSHPKSPATSEPDTVTTIALVQRMCVLMLSFAITNRARASPRCEGGSDLKCMHRHTVVFRE